MERYWYVWVGLVGLMFFVLVSKACASPFEVCDPNPGVSYYTITGQASCLGDASNIPAQADGSIKLDLACIAAGTTWNTQVKACNSWGDCSATVPFVYSRPVGPGVPSGIRLSK